MKLSRYVIPIAAVVIALLLVFVQLRARNTRREMAVDTPLPTTPAAPRIDTRPLPPAPPLPAPGIVDTLIGLVTVPAESIPRFETRETGYESLAITVYSRRRDWYLVGVRGGGRDWLHSRAVLRYFAVENLVQNRLNYLTESWDGRLRSSPEASETARQATLPPDALTERGMRRDVPAQVLEATNTGTSVWLKVEIRERSQCDGGGPGKVLATGWIPMWSTDGKPTAWFHSRGC